MVLCNSHVLMLPTGAALTLWQHRCRAISIVHADGPAPRYNPRGPTWVVQYQRAERVRGRSTAHWVVLVWAHTVRTRRALHDTPNIHAAARVRHKIAPLFLFKKVPTIVFEDVLRAQAPMAGCKTRLESRIICFNPIPFMIGVSGTSQPGAANCSTPTRARISALATPTAMTQGTPPFFADVSIVVHVREYHASARVGHGGGGGGRFRFARCILP